MYDINSMTRDAFVNRVKVYQIAHGWSRLQLTLLFDYLEEEEASSGEEHKFNAVDMLAKWSPYDSPDEWLQINSDHVERSNFADYDNPEWDDIRNCGNTVVSIFGSTEAIVSD